MSESTFIKLSDVIDVLHKGIEELQKNKVKIKLPDTFCPPTHDPVKNVAADPVEVKFINGPKIEDYRPLMRELEKNMFQKPNKED